MELTSYELILILKCFTIASVTLIVASFIICAISMTSINVAKKILNIRSFGVVSMVTLDTLKDNWQALDWTVKEVDSVSMYLRSGRWELWINEDMFNTNGTLNRKEHRMIGKTMDFLKSQIHDEVRL